MDATNAVQEVRKKLGLTQAALADELGVSQGSVSFYENGAVMPPAIAARLISLCASNGVEVSFDDLYASVVMR